MKINCFKIKVLVELCAFLFTMSNLENMKKDFRNFKVKEFIIMLDNAYIQVYTLIESIKNYLEVVIMNTNLSKWGNSAAIRIPKAILEELNIDSSNFENISFNIDVEGNKLILKKKQEKTKFELLAEKSKGEKVNPKTDIDWGKPMGKEVW